MKYKFISDGNWTADIKAPDTVDDGFGGLNGLVDVNVLGAGGDGAVASGPKIKFLTWSMLSYQMKGSLKSDDKSLDSAGIGAYSYLKFTGEVLPKVPVYFEIAAFENKSFDNLYRKEIKDKDGNVTTTGINWDKGFQNFATDLVFDPLYWLAGEKGSSPTNAVGATGWSYLGHFKVGISSDYVNWTYGAKYAKLPPHQINDWITVDKEWEAGYAAVGGFSAFELGTALQTLPFGTLKASLIPNRSADRAGNRYGLIAWANLNLGPVASIDLQYNGAYGTTFDKIFDTVVEGDYILGYKGIFGPITVKVNGLMNFYGSIENDDGSKTPFAPTSSDVGLTSDNPDNFISNVATNVQVNFANDTINATVGYRLRGSQAGMMYVEENDDSHWNISDQLGSVNTQRIWADVNANVTTALNIGLNPYVEMNLLTDATDVTGASKVSYKNDGVKIYLKPYFSLDLDEAFYIPGKLEGYVEGKAYTNDAKVITSAFGKKAKWDIESAGLKYSQTFSNDVVKGFNATYVFDNTNENQLFNYAYGAVNFAKDYTAQLGFGLRTANNDGDAPTNPFGFFVGATKKLPVLAKPTAYVQFMYAMDPYNEFNDGPTAYKLDGYKFKEHDNNAVKTYEENYAFRIGLQWDL